MGGNILSRTATRGISAENSHISAGGDIIICQSTSRHDPTHVHPRGNTVHEVSHPSIPAPENKHHLFPQPNPKFTGRSSKIEQIQAALQSCKGKTNWWERIVVIYGFGGMGKSELATVIADNCRQDYDYINWFDVETENSTKASFKQFGKVLKLECEPEVNCNEIYMTSQSRWKSGLFIFDNANVLESKGDMFGIRNFLPESCQTTHPIILVTSRHGESYWGEDLYNIKIIDIEKLDQMESYDCLVSYLGIAKEEITEELESAIVQLARQLDGYPLGLYTVGRLIAKSAKKLSLRGIKARIKDYTDILKEKSFEKLVGDLKMTALLEEILKWTIDRIEQEEDGSAALEVLAIVASMSSNDQSYVGLISAIYLNEEFSAYSKARDNFRFDDLDVKFKMCLSLLVSYSLITIDNYKNDKRYDVVHMHRLVKNSLLFSHMNNRNGSIALEKMIQYFIQGGYNKDFSDTFKELFSLISSRDPININQCMAVLACLIPTKDRDLSKHFVALDSLLQKRNLDPDQQKMMNILLLYTVMNMPFNPYDNHVIENRTLAQILAQPDSVVFHKRKVNNEPRHDRDTVLEDSTSQITIFQPEYDYTAEMLLELSQCFCRIHSTGKERSLGPMNFQISTVQTCQESFNKENIYFIVDPNDAFQDMLSLSSSFRAQFWVLSSCISVLYEQKWGCGNLPMQKELLNWVKTLWSECETTNRQGNIVNQIIKVVHYLNLGYKEALDTDFLSSVFKLSSELARLQFWKIISKKFYRTDFLLNAVNVDLLSKSLYFSKPARQFDFLYNSDYFLEITRKGVESASGSQTLCRLGFCKGVASAISNLINYCMNVDYDWDLWLITQRAFEWLIILFSLQKSNDFSCMPSLNDTLLNQFYSWEIFLQKRDKIFKVRAVIVNEHFRQYCAANKRKEWLDVTSKLLCTLDAQFQKLLDTCNSRNWSDIVDLLYGILIKSERMKRRLSFSKDFHTRALRVTIIGLENKETHIREDSILKSVLFWYYLFHHNPNLSNEMEIDLKPVMDQYAPKFSEYNIRREFKHMLKWNFSELQKLLMEFLEWAETENYATEFAQMILDVADDDVSSSGSECDNSEWLWGSY